MSLTALGIRWEQLQREYSDMAEEKFYEEFPNERPIKENGTDLPSVPEQPKDV